MKRLFALSTAMAMGKPKLAFVAGPPSPVDPNWPLPAMVVMMPVLLSIRRILRLIRSAIIKLPALSKATSMGKFKLAAIAGPLPDCFLLARR